MTVEMIEPVERVYPPFEVMVKRLFKLMPETLHSSLMHAAIGMSGEAGELLETASRLHVIEECGDIEFYMIAAEQQIGEAESSPVFDHRVGAKNILTVMANIVTLTADFLDVVKKSWVYNKPLNVASLHNYLAMIRINLDVLYAFVGTDFLQVTHANQVKLIGPGGRFESGFYSDAAAVARADKVGEETSNRSFIGKK